VPARIDVWSWSLAAPQSSSTRLWVSDDERAALGRVLSLERRERTRVAWAVRRKILAQALACSPPEVVLARTPCGTPILAMPGQRLFFSTSHSGAWAYLAVSRGVLLGVDVQQVDPKADVMRLARRFGRSEEVEFLRAMPESERLGAFFRLWTRKEAVLKAAGGGVPSKLRRTCVPLGPEAGPAEIQNNPTPWAVGSVRDLVAPDGYAAALAMAGDAAVMETRVEAPDVLTA